MAGEDVIVTKADGTQEAFDPQKLKDSLERSGATEKEIKKVLKEIEKILEHGITTKEIYKEAFSILQSMERGVALRYSLREAVMQLGPTGFPFEQFVGRILEELGYETEVGVRLKGMCTEHEVDVLAHHSSHTFIAEAKFHNDHGTKSDLQTALYVKARFDDLWESPHLSEREKPHAAWLITNTKFTDSAIEYGECAGMTLVSWNYPPQGNLQDMIEKSGLHPITALTTLNKQEKETLLKNDLVLCRVVADKYDELGSLGIPEKKHKEVRDEAAFVCDV